MADLWSNSALSAVEPGWLAARSSLPMRSCYGRTDRELQGIALAKIIRSRYIISVTGRHTSLRGVQKGGPSRFRMTLPPYIKPHATAVQRVAHLRSRGLIVKRPNVAARKIDLIGYERLRIYFLSRRQSGVPNRPFRPGTTYQQILRLYECDTLLREACFAAVGQFELLLRNAMSEALSDRHGSHPYFEPTAFKDAAANLDALQSFMTAFGQTKDQRALHYKQTYGTPILPPIWTMKEFLTFGRAVRLFKSLEGSLRTHIATQFGVKSDHTFTNWLECLVDLRNICAHHDRLFNRGFPKQPQGLKSAGVPTAPRNKLKAILECLDHLLTQRGNPVGIVAEVGRIIARFPEVQPAEAGY